MGETFQLFSNNITRSSIENNEVCLYKDSVDLLTFGSGSILTDAAKEGALKEKADEAENRYNC